MANVIKCSVCGENNLSDQEFCQYCQSRLQPLTGNLKGEDKPLTPGQIPTKKSTADLEPILPQWLRDARNSARQNSEEDAAQAEQQIPPTSQSQPASFGGDLLAGLHSQAQDDNEEEDTPDWLASITGETPKTKKPQKESQKEPSDVRWVELGDTSDFAQSESAPSDTPSWLADLNPSTSQPDEKDELTDWFHSADASQKPGQPSQPFSFGDQPSSIPPSGETEDWLHSMVSDDGAFNDSDTVNDDALISSDTPDWLRSLDAQDNAAQNSNALDTPHVSSDAPDWLRAMDAENAAQKSDAPPVSSDAPDWLRALDTQDNVTENFNTPGTSPVSSDTPDWLRALDAQDNAAQNFNTSGTPPVSSDAPDWLRAMDVENAAQKSDAPPVSSDAPDWLRTLDTQDKTQSADSAIFSETGSSESDAVLSSTGDTPDWLKGLESGVSSSDQDWLKGIQTGESEQPAAQGSITPAVEPEQTDALSSDIPSWLKAAAPQSFIFDDAPAELDVTSSAPTSSDTPDWLNTFKSDDAPEDKVVSAFAADERVDSAPPAFADNTKSNAEADALFTEMPDWLSIVDDSTSPESMPAPITNVDAIAPGDLPSWVQAMRPVDAGTPQSISTSLSDSKIFEARGALAGLQGVLPAAQGFSPTSKPKAYSIKLQASEEQLAHAALLEQILAAEAEPVPLGSFSTIGTSRGLRWFLVFIFFTVLTVVLFMRTQIFSMPVGLPVEVDSALKAVQAIPEGAPVLVAFDYEPARVGEMEVAAAPMFDQMLLLRHPRLTFISTNETGSILAERFISGPLAGHSYQSGVQYLNLGYLPGGQMGIRAFAQNPPLAAPYAITQNSNLLDLTLAPAWTLPPLEGVTSLSQFAALILVTDNADSARTWIEQTTSVRGAIPFVVVSSAQAAPMIQPYYASQQITGLMSGLYGGALFEQNNAGRPGTARIYWDAYSVGLLLAVLLILGGGLINMALGLRDRARAREAK